MTKLLSGPALTLNLRNRGIEVVSSSAPKQTETTQRWKIALAVRGRAVPQPTKIEFSRRTTTEEAVLEAIVPSVLAEHQAIAFLAPHLPLGPAVRQKVRALAGRREVQARDVFDLGAVLIPRTGGETSMLQADCSVIEAAMERAMSLSYADYKSQVGSYLHPDYRESMGSPEAWDAFQLKVVEYLDGVLSERRGPER